MPPPPTPHASAAALRPVPEPAYELRVQPRDDIGYGIALHRRGSSRSGNVPDGEQVVRVWGDPLLAILDQVLAVIRRAGYRSTDLNATRRAPFRIGEEDAVRIGLLFAALKPLAEVPTHRGGRGGRSRPWSARRCTTGSARWRQGRGRAGYSGRCGSWCRMSEGPRGEFLDLRDLGDGTMVGLSPQVGGSLGPGGCSLPGVTAS